MTPYADLVVYSPNGQIVLIAESKNRTGTTRTWAAGTRRNMLLHGTIPNSPYFLLALPARFYLWKDAGIEPELIEPTYEIDAYPFFQSYYEKMHISPEEIGYYSFKLLVSSWLNELSILGIPETIPEETKRQLQDSGLREALKNAEIVAQVPA